MTNAKGTLGQSEAGRPRANDELFVAGYFAREIDAGTTKRAAAAKGLGFIHICPDATGKWVPTIDRALSGDSLARRDREIASELEHLADVVAMHQAAGARTTWGRPIAFPKGFLPQEKPKRGRPPKNR